MNTTNISLKSDVLEVQAPEAGTLLSYGALIEAFNLGMPLPETLFIIN